MYTSDSLGLELTFDSAARSYTYWTDDPTKVGQHEEAIRVGLDAPYEHYNYEVAFDSPFSVSISAACDQTTYTFAD